jgi:hypothetical protein
VGAGLVRLRLRPIVGKYTEHDADHCLPVGNQSRQTLEAVWQPHTEWTLGTAQKQPEKLPEVLGTTLQY